MPINPYAPSRCALGDKITSSTASEIAFCHYCNRIRAILQPMDYKTWPAQFSCRTGLGRTSLFCSRLGRRIGLANQRQGCTSATHFARASARERATEGAGIELRPLFDSQHGFRMHLWPYMGRLLGFNVLCWHELELNSECFEHG